MLEIIWITLPLYLLILGGYAAFRWRYLVTDGLGALGAFAVKVSLPALIFLAIAVPREGAELEPGFFGVYLGASAVCLLVGRLLMGRVFRQGPAMSWVLGLGMANSNSAFMGFPIASLVFGAPAAGAFAMIIIVESAFMIPTAMIAATVAAQPGADWKALATRSLKETARNPLLISVALALVARGLGVIPPAPLATALTMLGAVAAPVALFAVGGTVARFPIGSNLRLPLVVAALKLTLHPLVTAAAFALVPGVSPDLARVGVLFAAMPMLSLLPLLGMAHGGEQVCATTLILATASSFVTVSLLASLIA